MLDTLNVSWTVGHITELKTNILDICPVSITWANSDEEERKSTECWFLIQQ
jgi:hypothetical protein